MKSKYAKIFTCVLLLVFLAEPLYFMAGNHPHESFYFSPLIGGGKGAFRKFEIDYYGTSLRSAVEWIAANADSSLEKNKIRVRCYYGEPESAAHFIKKYPRLVYVLAMEESSDWDYSIVLPVQAKHNHSLLENWPPKGTVHQIEAGGAPVVAIIKNYRTKDDILDNLKKNLNQVSSASAWLNYSFQFYRLGDYPFCVAAAKKALDYDPDNFIAYNNICSALNGLLLFKEAAIAGEKAVMLNPQSDLAKNNYRYSLSMINHEADKAVIARNYINLSLAHFQVEKYQECIEYCRESLLLKPDNAVAYNNICASFNALQEWNKAVKACEKALEIKNDFDLARNNLNYAKTKLSN